MELIQQIPCVAQQLYSIKIKGFVAKKHRKEPVAGRGSVPPGSNGGVVPLSRNATVPLSWLSVRLRDTSNDLHDAKVEGPIFPVFLFLSLKCRRLQDAAPGPPSRRHCKEHVFHRFVWQIIGKLV